MKIRVFLLLLCAWFSWSARAQQISVDDARNAARRFLQSGSPARRAKANMPLTLAYTASEGDKACFYVFNTPAEGSAYVIMGADEAAYEVLGYSDNGIFDYETAPANVRWWLSEYQRQIAEGMKQHVSARRQAPRRAASSFSSIAPLLKTTWNQGYPYNSEIPALVADPKSGSNLATGCVATAMAQVMYYHGCPAQGTGSKQYSKEIGNTTLVFSANFGATTYEWDKMQLSYNSNEQANAEANKAVATLMYHCGVSVDMDYGTINSGGSGASLADVPKALAAYFGYDKSAMNRYKSSFSDEEWLQIIYDELAAARPVLYAGRTATSGHAFVCDGYDETNAKWHFNWGWGGYCDGYYAINGSPALDPNGSGIGGAGENAQYSGSQQIVVNVKPDEGGQYAYEMSWDYQTGLTATEVTRGDATSLTGHWVNTSLEAISGEVGVKTINMTTNDVAYNRSFGFSSFGCGWYFDNNLSVPTTLLPPGQYSVQPVFRVAGGEWTPMVYGGTLPILTVKAPTSGVFVNPRPTVGNDEYATTDHTKLTVAFNVSNYGETSVQKTYQIDVYDVTDGDGVLRLRTAVDLPAHQDTKVEVPFYYKWSNLKKGQYLYQIDGNNFYFTVVDTKTINYTLTSAGYGTICLPFEAEVPSGMTAYACASLNDKELVLKPITGKMQPHTPYVLSGSEQTVTFEGPDIPNLKSTYTDGLLKGVIGTDYLLQADDYIMQNHNGNVAFYRVGSGSRFGKPATQYRSLLTSSSAVATVMFPDNEATAVETIAETPAFEPEAIYSLDGKRRASLQKGINILRTADGRTMKVLVK